MSSPNQMEDFDPNPTPPSPACNDPASGQPPISTQGDKDEEGQYLIIEMSPANPAPTDLFPNMTLQGVHNKYLVPGTKFADRDTLHDFVSLISKNYHFATSYACSAKIEYPQGKYRKSPESKPKNSIKIGCLYVVNFKALVLKKSADRSRNVAHFCEEI